MSKKQISRLSPVLACGLVLLLAFPLGAVAQEAEPAASGIDVVILLDDSGSMATCWPWSGMPRRDTCTASENPPSDPLDLRYSAVRLLTQLAGDDDRLAVVRFNAETQDIIGSLRLLGDRNGRQSLLDPVQPPDDYERAGGYTRIDLGLARAVQILSADETSARPRYVILLTDGVPTQEGSPTQDQAIERSVAELTRLGAQVFPVFLCNEKAGCPDDSFVTRTMGVVPEKAKTAEELLRVFSAVFAKMKPDLHVLDRRNTGGDIEFTIREQHGAQQLVVVAENGGLIALKRDGNPETISRAYQDPNLLINVVETGKLAPGLWTVETRGDSSFVVAQTQTVPELVFPPSSVPGNAAAPHFVPTGRPVLILAQISGPGASEQLWLNDSTLMEPIAQGDPMRWTVLPGGAGDVALQVGEDTAPLQIRRSFRIDVQADLPTALALSPGPGATCFPGEPCPLSAGFGPGAEIQDLQARVYVTDDKENGKLAYSGPMTCTDRECTDPAQAFKRQDGHTYTVRFLLQALSNGVVFGDWAESTLAMEPSVYLRGLPSALNLKMQPDGGWPVTIVAGTTEDLGQLRASIALTRTNDNTLVPDVQVDLTAEINRAGEQQAPLKVTLPSGLRPGSYEGLISFATDRASTGAKVRLPSPIAVSLNLARPAVHVEGAAVDFGQVLFDTSPNFRLDQSAYVQLAFDESPFNLAPELIDSTCPGLDVVAGPPELQDQAYRLPLVLRSSGPIAPQTCSGTLVLRGPSIDYDVDPATPLSWRLVIPAVEWNILGVLHGGDSATGANMGALGRAGERKGATLLVRYTGKPPFSLQLEDLNASAERSGVTVGKDDLDMVVAPVVQQGATDEYQVPVELLVKRSLSHDSEWARWLSGTDYTGNLKIQVAGLPASQSQEISLHLHNPSVYQRYVQPFYRLWLPGIVTIPLSVIIPLLLIVFAWKRRKDAGVERLLRQSRANVLTIESERFDNPHGSATEARTTGLPRWTETERGPKPSHEPGGGGAHMPQRQVRTTTTMTSTGTPATPSTKSPTSATVPPPHRRPGPSRPTTQKDRKIEG